jgi:transcriptional regulator with GAF, ATPase, and Fis domain
MRWEVCEARGGAEAFQMLEEHSPEALILDRWLPDLEIGALTTQVQQFFPHVDLLPMDGSAEQGGFRSTRRNELLQAVRESIPRVSEGPAWDTVPVRDGGASLPEESLAFEVARPLAPRQGQGPLTAQPLPGLIGQSAAMLELARLTRLVAPHDARVLIQGETGTGKELVAKALHALSPRAHKPLVVLNCAAVPEALLEAELFGHTRGAFTGAVQARVGRIEAAHGGTLFLDEIGEMPLALQAKLLRFLENGELQRVGENQVIRVDVRVIAATHKDLESMSEDGTFRLDLYHRLAVFPLDLPSLRERTEDIPLLCENFLAELATGSSRKYLSRSALNKLCSHAWPGNVRELSHVLQRGLILADSRLEIDESDILLRRPRKS